MRGLVNNLGKVLVHTVFWWVVMSALFDLSLPFTVTDKVKLEACEETRWYGGVWAPSPSPRYLLIVGPDTLETDAATWSRTRVGDFR